MPGMSVTSSSGGMDGMPGMSSTMSSTPENPFLGGDGGDVTYALHLVNGRDPMDPDVFTAKPGQRIRIRISNAGGDTAYQVGIPGVKLTGHAHRRVPRHPPRRRRAHGGDG